MRMMAEIPSEQKADDNVEYEDDQGEEHDDIEQEEEDEEDDDCIDDFEDGLEDGNEYDDEDAEGLEEQLAEFTVGGDSSDEEEYADCDGGYYQTWNPNHVCAIDNDVDDVRAALQRRARILIEKLLDVEQPTVTQRMAEYFEQPEVMETLISFITRLGSSGDVRENEQSEVGKSTRRDSTNSITKEEGSEEAGVFEKNATAVIEPPTDPALQDSVNRGTVMFRHSDSENDSEYQEAEDEDDDEFEKMIRRGHAKVRLNRDRCQAENDDLRRAYRATMLLAQPSRPFMRVICLLLQPIVRDLTCILAPTSDGSLHHYRAVIECMLRDRLLLGPLLEAMCHPYICSRLLDYIGDPAIAALIGSILTRRPESEMAKDWKRKIFACFAQCRIFDAIGTKIFTSDTSEAGLEAFTAASDLMFDMFETLPWQQGSELIFSELCQSDDFMEELMSATLGKYHPPGTSQHEVYTRMLSKFVGRSRESFINPPSGKGTGFSRGEVVPNGLASLHWRVSQIVAENVVSLCQVIAEKDVPPTPKKYLPAQRNFDQPDGTPEGTAPGGKRQSRHRIKSKAAARWLTEDTDRRLSGGAPPVRYSAYTVSRPFTIYRMNLLDIVVELGKSLKCGTLCQLPDDFWLSLVNWFFEYRHNNLLHKNFYFLLDVAVSENHIDSLRIILTKCKFISKAIDFYAEEGSSNRGFIMLCLNILRLKAQTLDKSEFLREHLDTHPMWKAFESTVINTTKMNTIVEPSMGRICLPTVAPLRPPPIDVAEWDATNVDIGSVYARLVGFCENPKEKIKKEESNPYDFEDDDAVTAPSFRYMRRSANRPRQRPPSADEKSSLLCNENLQDDGDDLSGWENVETPVESTDQGDENAASGKKVVKANIPRVKFFDEKESDKFSGNEPADKENSGGEIYAAASSVLSAMVAQVVEEQRPVSEGPAAEESWTPQQVIGEPLESRPAYPRPVSITLAPRPRLGSGVKQSSPLKSNQGQNLPARRPNSADAKKRPSSAQDLLQIAEQHLSLDADVEACLAAMIEKENMLPEGSKDSTFEMLVSKEDSKLPRGRRSRYNSNALKASKTPSPPHGNSIAAELGDRGSQTPPPKLTGRRIGRPNAFSQLTASWLRDDAENKDATQRTAAPAPAQRPLFVS